MKLLLDTHYALWTILDDPRAAVSARSIIEAQDTEVFYSILSVWEVTIKNSLHPDKMPMDGELFARVLEQSGIQCLGLKKRQIAMLPTLHRREGAREHRDPFDRMLLCQAKAEGMMLLTHDRLLVDYEEPCVITMM